MAVPANLTPEYMAAEERFKKSVTPQEKLDALEEMLRTIPKHKGTEKMQADIKRRISQFRKETQKKKGAASQRPFWYIEREGAGQVILCGPPNSGKSQLLVSLTQVEAEVADYPFTTRAPQPGMMRFEDIQVQIIDSPPLSPVMLEPWQLALITHADIALLVFDVNDPDLLEQTDFVLKTFREKGIRLSGDADPRVFVLGNKADLPGGEGNLQAWQELYEGQFQAVPFSALADGQVRDLKSKLFELLGIVRVYTKAPGKKPEENPTPYVLKKGSTVMDAAAHIHKDLADNLKFARIWGKHKFDGQMVERSYVLEDGDLIEIHA
jgi:uncharacterized protein